MGVAWWGMGIGGWCGLGACYVGLARALVGQCNPDPLARCFGRCVAGPSLWLWAGRVGYG